MKWHLCLVILAIFTSYSAVAEEEETNFENPPLVEVVHPEDSLAPYRERRENHGVLFSLNSENFYPKNYLSTLDNVIYTDLYGETPIPIIGAELSYKYNFSLGSISFGVGYGVGTITSSISGDKRTLDITRPFGAVSYFMDNLFREPIVAPYVELKAWQIGVKETSSTDSFSATTEAGFTYSLGVLVQLNAFDEETSQGATHNYGLENTYLDVFMAKSTQTQSSEDADTESDFSFGAGIRLEF